MKKVMSSFSLIDKVYAESFKINTDQKRKKQLGKIFWEMEL